MNYQKIDFQKLKRINPDTVGWIYLCDTPIDYPIVQEHDDGYYLTHNFSNEISHHGAVCLDANPNLRFPDRQNRIRAHNMSDGSMFHALTEYLELDFYKSHPYIEILTENARFSAKIWAVLKVPYSEEYLSIVPTNLIDFEVWRHIVVKRSFYTPEFMPTFADRNAVFCTCETEGEDGLAHGDVLIFAVLEDK